MSVCQKTPQEEYSANRQTYFDSFYCQVHELIQMGYQQIEADSHYNSEEPDITGELIRSICVVLEDETSPSWVEFYSVHDDPLCWSSETKTADSVRISRPYCAGPAKLKA